MLLLVKLCIFNYNIILLLDVSFSMLHSKDSSASSEEETSAAMAQFGRYNQNQKVDESDDDFNSNQFSSETATLSVFCKLKKITVVFISVMLVLLYFYLLLVVYFL